MDIASMADRLSAAASGASSSASAVAEPAAPASTPTVDSAPTPAPEPTPPITPEEPADLTFEDDEPELNFDEPAEPSPAATPTPVAAAPPAAHEESEFDNMLPKQVETAFLKTNRGRNLLATYKAERVLKEPPNFDPATGENIGGLGFMPTPQQTKEWHQRASDWEASHQEFETNPQSWVVNHFMAENGTAIRPGAEQVLSTLPTAINAAYDAAIKSGDRQAEERAVSAFKSVFQPMALEYINGLYDRARQIADPAQREQYLNGARTIEFDLTGKFRGDEQLTPPKPEDHLTARLKEIEQREQALQTWQQKNQSEQATQARNQLFTEMGDALTKDIERAFDTAGLRTALKPFAYKAAVNAYKQDVMNSVKQNQFAWRQINFALSKVGSARGADAAREAAQLYRQHSQTAIKATYRNVLKELVDGTVSQNAAARQTAAAAAAQTAPSVNGGQTPTQSVVPGVERVARQRGEDNADYFQKRLEQVVRGAAVSRR